MQRYSIIVILVHSQNPLVHSQTVVHSQKLLISTTLTYYCTEDCEQGSEMVFKKTNLSIVRADLRGMTSFICHFHVG